MEKEGQILTAMLASWRGRHFSAIAEPAPAAPAAPAALPALRHARHRG
jgi:hypothetical protein